MGFTRAWQALLKNEKVAQMSRFETEEEQIDAIKSWWKKNGTALLTGVLVVVVAVSGWRYWQNSQFVASANASATFEVLQNRALQGNFGEVAREALKLMNENPESPYATAAALMHAKYDIEKGDLEKAKENLQWAIDHSPSIELQSIAQMRLARLLAQQAEYTQAENLLGSIALAEQTALKADIDYLKGLLALSQQDNEQALQWFQAVLTNEQTDDNLRGLAEIQLADLTQ